MNFHKKCVSASSTIFRHKAALDRVFQSSFSEVDMDRIVAVVVADVADPFPGFFPFFFFDALEVEEDEGAFEEAELGALTLLLLPLEGVASWEEEEEFSPGQEASRKQLRNLTTAAAVASCGTD